MTDHNSKTTGTMALSYQGKVMVLQSATNTEQASEGTDENQRNVSLICDESTGNVIMRLTSETSTFEPIISACWDADENSDIIFLAPSE